LIRSRLDPVLAGLIRARINPAGQANQSASDMSH
jgi:hypothetical protein